MNNYPNFKNYNYTIKSYNKPYDDISSNMNDNIYQMNNNGYMKSQEKNIIQNNKSQNLFDPYNGFIRGNLFKNLYDPYKLKVPYDIKPMNEQAELLTYINSLGFSMIDLNLYLDIYPNDRNAIDLFNQYRKEKENLVNEYESKYGPITINSDSLSSYPWAWDDMPWPWDN